MLRACWFVLVVIVLSAVVWGESPKDSVGWRGNYTGLWPEARVPTTWSLQSDGIMAGLHSANSHAIDNITQAVDDGFLRHWLVLGPFAVADSVKEFDTPQVEKEESLAPEAGEEAGDKTWSVLEVPGPGRFAFGGTELEWVDLSKAMEFKLNQVAYAQTYLLSQKAGKVRVVVEHGHGLKVWCNGKEVYKNAGRGEGIGNYVFISKNKLDNTWPVAPSFELDLQKGMNRLTVKVSSANKGGWKEMRF